MHKVERAIILAAGIGKRMNPVTLKTPKPLVKVNGVRMIDTIIKALYDNGITEIYIVVGYLKEQFSEVLKEYQGITLIENPYYATTFHHCMLRGTILKMQLFWMEIRSFIMREF